MNVDALLAQIDPVVEEFRDMVARSKHDDASDFPADQRQALVARAIAFVDRVAGRDSSYAEEIRRIQGVSKYLFQHAAQVIGVAVSLREDLAAGYLVTLKELIHADQMGDLLGMSDELLGKGYKDPAAVIAGAVLESHLRNLSDRNSLPTEKSDGRPLSMGALNAALRKAEVYTKLDEKSVTAWAGLRNEAAHGNYGAYETAQVSNMLDGVRAFLIRHPA